MAALILPDGFEQLADRVRIPEKSVSSTYAKNALKASHSG